MDINLKYFRDLKNLSKTTHRCLATHKLENDKSKKEYYSLIKEMKKKSYTQLIFTNEIIIGLIEHYFYYKNYQIVEIKIREIGDNNIPQIVTIEKQGSLRKSDSDKDLKANCLVLEKFKKRKDELSILSVKMKGPKANFSIYSRGVLSYKGEKDELSTLLRIIKSLI